MTHVIVRDLRAAGVCPAARSWFERNGLDWRDFVKNGLDADHVRHIEDARDMIGAIIRAAEEREAKEARHGR